MTTIVDPEKCIGCTLCAQICPEVFKMEQDKAAAYTNPVPENLMELAKQAADQCPVDAITIEDKY